MKITTVEHPILKEKSVEVLFSRDSEENFLSLDGNDLCYFKKAGFVQGPVKQFCKDDVTPLRIMGKVLAEKIHLLHYHVRYKDENTYLELFWRIANALVGQQYRFSDDLELPEIVLLLADTPIRLLTHC